MGGLDPPIQFLKLVRSVTGKPLISNRKLREPDV
jgi:hypothetical protein